MGNPYAPKGAKPSLHGNRLYLTEHGRLVQSGDGGRDIGGVFPMLANAAAVPSTAITNSNTETVFDNGSFTIPAGWLRAGSLLRFGWQGIATATNSTDTLTVKAYVNATSVATSSATDAVTNDIFAGEAAVIIRTTGASGTFVANASFTKTEAASLTASRVDQITASTAIDTTAAVVIAVKATWSVTSASDSCRLDMFWLTVT